MWGYGFSSILCLTVFVQVSPRALQGVHDV